MSFRAYVLHKLWTTITRREQLLLAVRPVDPAWRLAAGRWRRAAGTDQGRQEDRRSMRRIRPLYGRGRDAGAGSVAGDRADGGGGLHRLHRRLDRHAARRDAAVLTPGPSSRRSGEHSGEDLSQGPQLPRAWSGPLAGVSSFPLLHVSLRNEYTQ